MSIFDKLLGKRGNKDSGVGIPPPPAPPEYNKPMQNNDLPNLVPEPPSYPKPENSAVIPPDIQEISSGEESRMPKLEDISPSVQEIKETQVQDMPAAQQETSELRIEKHAVMPGKPLFIRVGDYREVLQGTANIKSHLKEADSVIQRVNELKDEQEKEFNRWKSIIEDINRKMIYVDKVLFESG